MWGRGTWSTCRENMVVEGLVDGDRKANRRQKEIERKIGGSKISSA